MIKKKTVNNVKLSKYYIIIGFLFFVVVILRISFLALSKEIDGIDIQDFASKRTTKNDFLYAKRGTIYDTNSEVLAHNVSSYTLIAYLSDKRTTDPSNPQHVVDKEYTAEKLAPILNMTKEDILKYLNKSNLYQTEFGTKGRGITELTKSKIEELDLPGIDFIETQKRYYPYGKFLSYTLGYAKVNTIEDENGNSEEKITGEMGIEKQFDNELSGKDGYTFYQKDRNGFKIVNTPEIKVDKEDGYDIYLTIDSEIQLFVEDALNKINQKSKNDWITMIVADAETGAILASSSTPSFDPNTRENIPTYLDYNISYAFEPGSTMKTYTYMAVMENGNYNGSETYKSGVYKTKDGTLIGDWDREGWGTISFDKGYTISSNTGIINLINRKINGDILKDYFLKLGFGSKTNIELANEQKGKIAFKYETEILNAGFGQGITTTPIQQIKALTSISNDGVLLQPYIIKKIVNPNNGEIIYEGKKQELEKVASQETVDKIKDLMYKVVNTKTGAAGSYYKMDGYDLIGKTGTAQVAKEKGGGYYSDQTVSSFAGMFPKDDPKIVFYIASKNLANINAMVAGVKDVVKNVSNYLNIYEKKEKEKTQNTKVTIESYINKDVNTIKKELESKKINVIVIGNGNKIIDQYPKKDDVITSIDKVFLLTNSDSIKMIDMNNWSRKDIISFCNLANLEVVFDGEGYLYEQSIKKDALIKKTDVLNAKLKEKKK